METIKRIIYSLLLTILLTPAGIADGQVFRLESPDGKLKIRINLDEGVQWSLQHENDIVLDRSAISLAIKEGKVLGKNPRLIDSVRKSVDAIIPSPLYKKSQVIDRYNELTLRFADSFSLIFRAYDDGAAYRFATSIPGGIQVGWEECNFNLAENHRIVAPYLESHEEDIYASSFESLYQYIRIADFDTEKLSYTPVIIDLGNGKKAAIMEADLEDYPGLFLKLNRETHSWTV